jgi:hypothetical protein
MQEYKMPGLRFSLYDIFSFVGLFGAVMATYHLFVSLNDGTGAIDSPLLLVVWLLLGGCTGAAALAPVQRKTAGTLLGVLIAMTVFLWRLR